MSYKKCKTIPTEKPPISNVPNIEGPKTAIHNEDVGNRAGHWMIAVCCIPMVAIVGIIIWNNGLQAGFSDTLTAIAPLTVCVAAHFLMYKLLGRSCHGKDNFDKKDQLNEKNI